MIAQDPAAEWKRKSYATYRRKATCYNVTG
jgi:hypothetical protein